MDRGIVRADARDVADPRSVTQTLNMVAIEATPAEARWLRRFLRMIRAATATVLGTRAVVLFVIANLIGATAIWLVIQATPVVLAWFGNPYAGADRGYDAPRETATTVATPCAFAMVEYRGIPFCPAVEPTTDNPLGFARSP